jgi:hypothetical protein
MHIVDKRKGGKRERVQEEKLREMKSNFTGECTGNFMVLKCYLNSLIKVHKMLEDEQVRARDNETHITFSTHIFPFIKLEMKTKPQGDDENHT